MFWQGMGVARPCTRARARSATLLSRIGESKKWHGRANEHGQAVPNFCPSTVQVAFCAVCDLAFGLILGLCLERCLGLEAWPRG